LGRLGLQKYKAGAQTIHISCAFGRLVGSHTEALLTTGSESVRAGFDVNLTESQYENRREIPAQTHARPCCLGRSRMLSQAERRSRLNRPEKEKHCQQIAAGSLLAKNSFLELSANSIGYFQERRNKWTPIKNC